MDKKSNQVEKLMQSNVNLCYVLDCFLNLKKNHAKLSRYYFLIINSIYIIIR